MIEGPMIDDDAPGCADCGHDRPGPVLHDDVWATIAAPDVLLCFACTEKRLGRRLLVRDLTVCPINIGIGWLEPGAGPDDAIPNATELEEL
jgi:hypothetical protein